MGIFAIDETCSRTSYLCLPICEYKSNAMTKSKEFGGSRFENKDCEKDKRLKFHFDLYQRKHNVMYTQVAISRFSLLYKVLIIMT